MRAPVWQQPPEPGKGGRGKRAALGQSGDGSADLPRLHGRQLLEEAGLYLPTRRLRYSKTKDNFIVKVDFLRQGVHDNNE